VIFDGGEYAVPINKEMTIPCAGFFLFACAQGMVRDAVISTLSRMRVLKTKIPLWIAAKAIYAGG